jgi:hypothetical protein
MELIGLDVCQIIDDIDGTGDQTKQNEAERDSQERFDYEELAVKDQARINYGVFRPLSGPHCAD